MRLKKAVLTSVLSSMMTAIGMHAASVELIGTATIPGNATDLSGLTETITAAGGSIPHNQLGAFGSGLTYTGTGNLYVAVNDRGFGDGAPVPYYYDRMQVFNIGVDAATKTVTPQLVDTRLLRDMNGQSYVGQSAAFNTVNPASTQRFDPEAVRVGRDGSIFISDEYGPYIKQFNQNGTQTASINVPSKFQIANPSADGAAELANNTVGRQSNRGMEGMAITPDGKTLYGMMQNPLLQDGALNASGNRTGVNDRILQVDIATGQTKEFVYQLNSGANNGVNEILAVNDHQFLALERDGRAGDNARVKQVYLIDINGATDVSAIGTTAVNGLPANGSNGFTPVQKSLFLDLLDPAYGLAGANFPEKLEGLAWGPNLPDGRHLLLVTSDNDLLANNPSWFYAFAIDPSALPGYQAQVFDAGFAGSSVPEPSTIFLIGAGLSLTVYRLRRRA